MQARTAFLGDPRLDAWLKQLPRRVRNRLRGRLNSEARRDWLAALAELFWIQHASGMGWMYQAEPTLPTGGTPELLVTAPGPFYLEVKTAFDEIQVEMQNRGLLKLIEALDPLVQSGAWTLRFDDFPIGYGVQPAVDRVRAALAANPDTTSIPCDATRTVTLERIPGSNSSGILYSAHLVRWLPEEELVTASLDDKALSYRPTHLGGTAYVIALFSGDDQVIGLSGVADVLYGRAGAYVAYDAGLPFGLVAAHRKGGWFARPDTAHVSAVAFTRLGPMGDALRAQSWVFHNPNASTPLANGTFAPLPEAMGPQTTEAIAWTTNTSEMNL